MTLRDFLISIGVSDRVANTEFFGSIIDQEIIVNNSSECVQYCSCQMDAEIDVVYRNNNKIYLGIGVGK